MDTVRVGPVSGMRRLGIPTRQTTFGLIVRVEQLGKRSKLRIDPGSEVVLVPWELDSECNPIPWTRATAWIPAGTRGLYSGTLRKRSEWVGGRPTFDVRDPYETPYMASARGRHADPSPTSVTDLLAIIDLLPEARRGRDSTRVIKSYAPLLEWARTHPEVARTSAAHAIVMQARAAVTHARTEAIVSPIAGTWRFSVRQPGGDSAVFFASSERNPLNGMSTLSRTAASTYRADSLPIDLGYNLLTYFGQSARAALTASDRTLEGMSRQGYLTVAISPLSRTRDSTTWAGNVQLFGAAARTVQGRHKELLASAEKRIEELPSYVPGRFVLHRDGRATFDLVLSSPGQSPLVIHGVRASTAVRPTVR